MKTSTDIHSQLAHWIEHKPLVLFRFDEKFSDQVRESRHGFDKFTLTLRHDDAETMKLPTLCLVEIFEDEEVQCCVGVIKSKTAVSTFDSRLTFAKLRRLDLDSFNSILAALVERRQQTLLRRQLNGLAFSAVLSPKLSSAIISTLWNKPFNRNALEATVLHLPRFRRLSVGEWGQLDAIKLAMAVFGLAASEKPAMSLVTADSDSAFDHIDGRLLEDNVIGADASTIPGFSLIEKTWTGRAVFEKEGERLEVYTANRGPLEKMLGVDLIYINSHLGSTVMVQYKMLEDVQNEQGASRDWIFRPDKQLKLEMARMKIPSVSEKPGDYRLVRNPFFFKFVKRRPAEDSPHSIILSYDHLTQILKSQSMKGPKGGVRLSYQALDGAYLREGDLIGLIRSGYIGTHRVETMTLTPIIAEVANGNRALVLAWQSRLQMEDRQ